MRDEDPREESRRLRLQAEIAQTRALLARAELVEVLRQCRFAAERQNRPAPRGGEQQQVSQRSTA